MNAVKVFKVVAGALASTGISKIISGVVKSNVVTDTKFRKVCVFAGEFAIGMYVTDKVLEHASEQVDKTINTIKEMKKATEPEETNS